MFLLESLPLTISVWIFHWLIGSSNSIILHDSFKFLQIYDWHQLLPNPDGCVFILVMRFLRFYFFVPQAKRKILLHQFVKTTNYIRVDGYLRNEFTFSPDCCDWSSKDTKNDINTPWIIQPVQVIKQKWKRVHSFNSWLCQVFSFYSVPTMKTFTTALAHNNWNGKSATK